jgi:hypothetical protein
MSALNTDGDEGAVFETFGYTALCTEKIVEFLATPLGINLSSSHQVDFTGSLKVYLICVKVV